MVINWIFKNSPCMVVALDRLCNLIVVVHQSNEDERAEHKWL